MVYNVTHHFWKEWNIFNAQTYHYIWFHSASVQLSFKFHLFLFSVFHCHNNLTFGSCGSCYCSDIYIYIYFLPPAAVSCARSGSSRSWTCPTILSLSTCLPVSRQRSMCVSSWSTQPEATLWCTSTPMFSQSPELCKCSYMLILMSWFVFYNLLTSCPGTRDTDSHQLFLTELYAWLNLIQFYYTCNLI